MKKTAYLSILLGIMISVPLMPAEAADLATKFKGRILLAVESNGEAWYVNPTDLKRYYLGRPADAFALMRKLGLGISNKDFKTYEGKLPDRLLGRILIKVEDSGKAYYADPVSKRLYYMGRPNDAFNVMRGLGLGFSNANLNLIPADAKNSVPSITVTKYDQLTLGVVESQTNGWVVIRKQVNGQPSDMVGYSAIKAGKNYNVVVKLSGISESQYLIAITHNDLGKGGVFEYPGADLPQEFDGKTVTKKFFYVDSNSVN